MNSALLRTTGYMLTRETPQQREQAIQQAATRARKRTAERLRRRVAAERAAKRAVKQQLTRALQQIERERRAGEQRDAEHASVTAAQAARIRRQRARINLLAGAPTHFDPDMRLTVKRVGPRTMTGFRKLQALIEATRYISREQIPGAVVECGVWRGGSMQAVALTLLQAGDTQRELHLFDTFEGMPPPTAEDTRTRGTTTTAAGDLLATADRDGNLWAIADLDDVKQGMAEVDYPADKIHFHPGLVEDTTPAQAPEQIALLRLDTDWYASTRHELDVLYKRLSPGGILIIDDFADWDGARKATEEWLATLGQPLFLAPMEGGRIAMKPVESGA